MQAVDNNMLKMLHDKLVLKTTEHRIIFFQLTVYTTAFMKIFFVAYPKKNVLIQQRNCPVTD